MGPRPALRIETALSLRPSEAALSIAGPFNFSPTVRRVAHAPRLVGLPLAWLSRRFVPGTLQM